MSIICPDCDQTAPARTPHCDGCGFAFQIGPTPPIVWLPSEEGEVEFGVEEGTPLWDYVQPPTKEAVDDQPVEPPKRAGRGKQVKPGIDATQNANRIDALIDFYSFAEETETPYERGALKADDIGPDEAPQTRGSDVPAAQRRMIHDPS